MEPRLLEYREAFNVGVLRRRHAHQPELPPLVPMTGESRMTSRSDEPVDIVTSRYKIYVSGGATTRGHCACRHV
jgi:hypothetical protein